MQIKISLNATLMEKYITDANHLPENTHNEIHKKLHTAFITTHLSYKKPKKINEPTNR